MTYLTFYGGVNEVGGTKILLEDKDTSEFIDFGESFSLNKKFYSEFNKPRGFRDYLMMGLVPKLYGIYRHDLLEDANEKLHDRPVVDAVIISHSHMDHCAYVSFLDSDITVCCSVPTKKSIEAFEKVSKRSLKTEITSYRKIYDPERKIIFRNMKFPQPTKKEPNRKATHYRTMLQEKIPPPPVKRNFITKNKISIGSIEVELYPVDHSTFDAHGCIIHTSDATIVYTGDIRFHGPNSKRSYEFVEKAKEERPDVLITEGTRIDEKTTLTESDVEWLSKKLIEKTKGLVFVNFQYRDLYRLKTFKNVAEATNRILVTSPKYPAYWKYLREYFPDILSGVLRYRTRTRMSVRPPESVIAIEDEEICSHPDRYIVHLSYYEFGKIIDFSPPPGSIMIQSTSEPYDEEEEIEAMKINNWCNYFGLPHYHIHSSGHMSGPDLIWMIEEINPKFILPIHATFENAKLIKEKFSEKTKILEKGERFKIPENKKGLLNYM